MATQLDVATRLAAISRLTGGVAHEIKNPLERHRASAGVAEGSSGRAGPRTRREIEILSKEVQRLDRVVKTFLDFTRPVEVHLRTSTWAPWRAK